MTEILELVGSVSSILLLKLFLERFFYWKQGSSSIGLAIYLSGFIAVLAVINVFSSASVACKAIFVILGTIGLCCLFYDTSCLQAIFISVSYEVIAAVLEIMEMGILSLNGIRILRLFCEFFDYKRELAGRCQPLCLHI